MKVHISWIWQKCHFTLTMSRLKKCGAMSIVATLPFIVCGFGRYDQISTGIDECGLSAQDDPVPGTCVGLRLVIRRDRASMTDHRCGSMARLRDSASPRHEIGCSFSYRCHRRPSSISIVSFMVRVRLHFTQNQRSAPWAQSTRAGWFATQPTGYS